MADLQSWDDLLTPQQFVAPTDTEEDVPKLSDKDVLKAQIKDDLNNRLSVGDKDSNEVDAEAEKRAQDVIDKKKEADRLRSMLNLSAGIKAPASTSDNTDSDDQDTLQMPNTQAMNFISPANQYKGMVNPNMIVDAPALMPQPDKTMNNISDSNQDSEPFVASTKDTKPDQDLTLANLNRIKASQQPNNPNAIEDALRRSNNLASLMLAVKGAGQIGAGLTRQKFDDKYLNSVEPLINKPIEDVLNQQKLNQNQLAQQLQARQVAIAQSSDDPDSPVSQLSRKIVKDNFPDMAGSTPNFDKLSNTDLEQTFPALKSFNEANKALLEKYALINANKQTSMENKKEKDLDAANTKFVQQVMQVRGDKSINNQKETVRRVDNAMSILNDPQYRNPVTGQPDFNKIPDNVASIITTDLGNIVNGGVTGEQGIKELSNPTIWSKLSRGYQGLSNKPTGANLGAFLKQNQSLLQGLKDNAQSAIKDRYDYIDSTLGQHIRPEDRESSRSAFERDFLGNRSTSKYSDVAHEDAIKHVMDNNPNVTRDQAINALKNAGKW